MIIDWIQRDGRVEQTPPGLVPSGAALDSLLFFSATTRDCRRKLRIRSLFLSLCGHAAVLTLIFRVTVYPGGIGAEKAAVDIEIVERPEHANYAAEHPAPDVVNAPVPRPLVAVEPHRTALPPKLKSRQFPKDKTSLQQIAPEARDEASASDVLAAEESPATPPQSFGSQAAGEDILRMYAQILWVRIMEHKPRGARYKGTVELSFTLAADGNLVSSQISRSSGSEILDMIAMNALRQGAPFPPPPKNTTAEQLSFSIPFIFQ